MKILKAIFATCLLATSVQSQATTYNDVVGKMGRIELSNTDNSIWLMRPWGNLAAIQIEDCLASQVQLTPPAGKENAWLNLLISAAAQKHKVSVVGSCNTSGQYIIGTRLIVEYNP